MINVLLKPLNYAWHSVAAPSLSISYNGTDISISRLESIKTFSAKDTTDIMLKDFSMDLAGYETIRDRVHRSLKAINGQSPCSVMDDAEEGDIKDLFDLLNKGSIDPQTPLLHIETQLPSGKKQVVICLGSKEELLQKMRSQVQKVEKYDTKHPIWQTQRRKQPSSAYKALTASPVS